MSIKQLLEKHNILHGYEVDQSNIDAFISELAYEFEKIIGYKATREQYDQVADDYEDEPYKAMIIMGRMDINDQLRDNQHAKLDDFINPAILEEAKKER